MNFHGDRSSPKIIFTDILSSVVFWLEEKLSYGKCRKPERKPEKEGKSKSRVQSSQALYEKGSTCTTQSVTAKTTSG
jgi:hypothetical protein